MLDSIGLAVAVAGGVSLVIGLLLGFAARIFHVHVDEREIMVRELLPGGNCGGCGYAGCDALAAAIAKGEAMPNCCPVGGQETAHRIAELMGVEAGEVVQETAFVRCSGTCDKIKREADYFGILDCRQAAAVPGYAGKSCPTACFGLGTCAAVCPTGAIRVVDGVAKVDKDKCIHCGACVNSCPQRIIAMRPKEGPVAVACSSHKAGKAVKAVCDAGCIACGICQKVCPNDAIHVVDNLAQVDYNKCIACGACVAKCPVKVIHTTAD